tara:strand:- start:4361 stop:6256 length:1896 start_codon:yes stop_codon:yes gene_type:complete
MENIVNEGQTQVYADGAIDAQPGVNTSAPYLNNPKQQLLDIIHVLFKQSGKMSDVVPTGQNQSSKITHGGAMTDQQVMTILVGMGIPQQMAMSGIAKYHAISSQSNIYTENNNQKNHNKMKFTLTDLYENVVDSINGLKAMDNDNSRVSYSVKESLTILENAIAAFPMKLKNADLSAISEELENSVNPDLKFKIARNLYTKLAQSTWLNPISELREYIMESYNNAKWEFRISESIARTENQKGKLIESLNSDLVSLLNESDVKSKFSIVAAKHPWSIDAKQIVNEMNAEDQKVASTANGKVVSVLSPVLESEEGLTFHLHGKNYTYNGTNITEANVTDPRFFDVSEGLNMFSRNGNILSLHGENNKSLEYNITEGTLTMGKVNMTNYSIIELKEALLATNFSGYRNQWQNDKICKFFESIDLLAEMDNFTTIQNQEFVDVFLTMIGVSEGFFINKVNPGMQLNEMLKIDTATKTVEVVKEFINFDVSPILSEKLIAENNDKAIEESKRKDLTDSISFLEEKKSEVEAAIKKLGETEELTEALNLLAEELNGKEKELANSYISEKKTKDDYLNDGFVEASVKTASQGLKVRQEVLVSAEEYASLGDDDMLSVIIPKNGKSIVMPKGDLEVKI